MAIDESKFIPEAPPFARSNPQAYYAWLTSNGFPHRAAYDQTTAIFGAPKSPDEIEKDRARQQQQAGLAQTGGAIAGSIGAQYVASQLMGSGAAATGGTAAGGAASGTAAGTATAGGTTASGAGAASGTGAASGSSTLGSIGAYALPVAAVVAGVNNMWETGMKDIVRGRGDRADWTNQAVNALPVLGVPGTGGIINLGLRLAGKRSVGEMIKTGKSMPQQLRDDFRGDLKEAGVADKDYMIKLADGTKFNIGLDGKTKYENVGENVDGKTSRNAWDVDFSNPLAKYATDRIEPMIRNIYGADNAKAKYFPGQYTGMLVNAVTSNAKSEADVMANINAVLGQSKFAKGTGADYKPPPPPKAPKGQVLRVSPGMYVNDKGQVKPAKSVGDALKTNYNKTKEKK
jgi:hypothetical protein